MCRFLPIAFCLFASLPADADARQSQVIPGPVRADVVEVIDGDSIKVSAHIWPGQNVLVNIRIRGIDAPELKSRCSTEKGAALAARQMTSNLVSGGSIVLTNISGGKYYGRMLADVANLEGSDLASKLLDARLVRPYSGKKRRSWCKPD